MIEGHLFSLVLRSNSMTVLVCDDACKNVGWCELTLSTDVDIIYTYEGKNEQGATQAPTRD